MGCYICEEGRGGGLMCVCGGGGAYNRNSIFVSR